MQQPKQSEVTVLPLDFVQTVQFLVDFAHVKRECVWVCKSVASSACWARYFRPKQLTSLHTIFHMHINIAAHFFHLSFIVTSKLHRPIDIIYTKRKKVFSVQTCTSLWLRRLHPSVEQLADFFYFYSIIILIHSLRIWRDTLNREPNIRCMFCAEEMYKNKNWFTFHT